VFDGNDEEEANELPIAAFCKLCCGGFGAAVDKYLVVTTTGEPF